MVNRTALLVSGIFAAALAATSGNAAPEAEECLARPKGAAPAGKHWYYNTNRETNRKCWYLADEGAKVVAAAPKRSVAPKQQPAAAPPAEADKETPPAASARVEPVDEPKVEEPVVSATESEPETAPAATVGNATMPGWEAASRWPLESDAFSPGRSTISDPTPAARAESQSSAFAAHRLVAVEQPSAPVESSEARLAAFEMKPAYVAAFVLVAIVFGGVTVMFVGSRRRDRREFRSEREVPRGDVELREMPWTGSAAAPSNRHARRRSIIAAE